jgi:hypothetical protein
MADLVVSPASKYQQVSQQDSNIVMTCIDHRDIFALSLYDSHHKVFSVAPSSSSHFTPYLFHQPWSILQSFVPTLGAYPPHEQRLCIPCPSCGHLYITRASEHITRHHALHTSSHQLLGC